MEIRYTDLRYMTKADLKKVFLFLTFLAILQKLQMFGSILNHCLEFINDFEGFSTDCP